MIEMSTYMTSIGILSAIIVPLIIQCLKINKLQKEKSDVIKENATLQNQNAKLQKSLDELQAQVLKQENLIRRQREAKGPDMVDNSLVW
jgi:regulator of replication initiation timing